MGTFNENARDKMLKEASEYDKRSASNKAADKDDFNEALLDGPKKTEKG